jgi:predicted regulator of amino acid metabolism with ACT domain
MFDEIMEKFADSPGQQSVIRLLTRGVRELLHNLVEHGDSNGSLG